jgi:hypothetical protein
MSSNSNEKIEITVSVTKDGQTVKAVLDYNTVKDINDLHNVDLIEQTINSLLQEIERGI